jgi:putative N6-adenine-specific DNA methylase
MKLIVKTMHGLEPILARELSQLGAKNVKELKRAVSCQGDNEVLYKANYHCRTALRVLVPQEEFTAWDEQSLYKSIQKMDWSKYLDNDKTFAINATVNSDRFTHSHYVGLKIKDAIVDQFRERTGKRPDVDVDDPDVRIHAHCYVDRFSISLDSSGDALHKRGYRIQGHEAPINEVLAAGLIELSGWDKKSDFLDPMCGTGTIAIEAAMMATKTPPGLLRRKYGFMKFKDFDEELWQKVKAEGSDAIMDSACEIKASDMSIKSVEMTREAASIIGLEGSIEVTEQNFFHTSAEDATVIMNPPYGERIGSMDMNEFYKSLGDHFKQNYQGCNASLISSNLQALKRFGLRPSKKSVVFNGSLECRFQTFEMYKGSKKAKYQQ